MWKFLLALYAFLVLNVSTAQFSHTGLTRTFFLYIWMNRCQLICHNQEVYLDEKTQMKKFFTLHALKAALRCCKAEFTCFSICFFQKHLCVCLRTAVEGGDYLFLSFLRLPLVSPTFRHQPGYSCRERTSVQSWQPNQNREPLVS